MSQSAETLLKEDREHKTPSSLFCGSSVQILVGNLTEFTTFTCQENGRHQYNETDKSDNNALEGYMTSNPVNVTVYIPPSKN